MEEFNREETTEEPTSEIPATPKSGGSGSMIGSIIVIIVIIIGGLYFWGSSNDGDVVDDPSNEDPTPAGTEEVVDAMELIGDETTEGDDTVADPEVTE